MVDIARIMNHKPIVSVFYSGYDSTQSMLSTLSSLFDFFENFLVKVKIYFYLINDSNCLIYYCILALGRAMGRSGLGLGCPMTHPAKEICVPARQLPSGPSLPWKPNKSTLPHPQFPSPLYFKYLKYGFSLHAKVKFDYRICRSAFPRMK